MSEREDQQAQTRAIQVYYDGACPLCRREIALYSGLKSICAIQWTDVSAESSALPQGRSREAMLARFHVTDSQGRLVSGAAAFLTLWESLPGWIWLAKLGRLPGMRWVLEQGYRGFLIIRPAMQRLARRVG